MPSSPTLTHIIPSKFLTPPLTSWPSPQPNMIQAGDVAHLVEAGVGDLGEVVMLVVVAHVVGQSVQRAVVRVRLLALQIQTRISQTCEPVMPCMLKLSTFTSSFTNMHPTQSFVQCGDNGTLHEVCIATAKPLHATPHPPFVSLLHCLAPSLSLALSLPVCDVQRDRDQASEYKRTTECPLHHNTYQQSAE